MAPIRRIGIVLSLCASTLWVFPANVLGDGPNSRSAPPVAVRDVALGPNGELAGQFVDMQGRPLAGKVVSLIRGDREVARVATDAEGRYLLTGLTGGNYQIVSGSESANCRCWTYGAAPPSAANGFLLVAGDVQRGQQPIEKLIFSDPILIGLFVGAAIAVPLAIHQSKDDAAPGS